jgi:hypothetical protein
MPGGAITLTRPSALIANVMPEDFDLQRKHDARVLREHFPLRSRITSARLTGDGIRERLLTDQFDIVQLTTNIDAGGEIRVGHGSLPARGFVELLRQARAKLLVLSSCQSVSLAANVAPHVNMIAGTDNLNTEAWCRWSEISDRLLSSGVPLSRSFAVAQAVVDAPSAMIMHRDLVILR